MSPKIPVDDLPEGFDENTMMVFDIISAVVEETVNIGRDEGLSRDQLISALVSVTVTHLMRITDDKDQTASILRSAAKSIEGVQLAGAPKDGPIH